LAESNISDCVKVALPVAEPVVGEDGEQIDNELAATRSKIFLDSLQKVIYHDCVFLLDNPGPPVVGHKEVHEDVQEEKRVHDPVRNDDSLSMVVEGVPKKIRFLFSSAVPEGDNQEIIKNEKGLDGLPQETKFRVWHNYSPLEGPPWLLILHETSAL
jgi:hypothetical protein